MTFTHNNLKVGEKMLLPEYIKEISTMKVEPDDIVKVVFKFGKIKNSEMKSVYEQVKELFPNNKVIAVIDNADIKVEGTNEDN